MTTPRCAGRPSALPKSRTALRLKIVVAGEAKKTKEKTKAIAVPASLTLSIDPKFDPAPALELILRPPRHGGTDGRSKTRTRSHQPARGGLHPPATAQAWREPRAHVRAQLLVTLGLWPMFPKTPLNPEVRGRSSIATATRSRRFVLETFPASRCAGNLYRPAGTAAGKLPVVLCPHGHWEDGRVNPEVQQRCIRWAKLGFVVFMYDMVGYNDSKPFGHAFLNDRLRRWGLSLPTLQTWNSIRALDWLTTLPDVDPARIGCTGESGGGTQTFLLTAIDDARQGRRRRW